MTATYPNPPHTEMVGNPGATYNNHYPTAWADGGCQHEWRHRDHSSGGDLWWCDDKTCGAVIGYPDGRCTTIPATADPDGPFGYPPYPPSTRPVCLNYQPTRWGGRWGEEI